MEGRSIVPTKISGAPQAGARHFVELSFAQSGMDVERW